ncbi:MAG: hypothetical protein JRE61_02780 [Deltaproteobacteria bacterium]|nr:hypothetical protein [Deltaproteobacteria bacterium]
MNKVFDGLERRCPSRTNGEDGLPCWKIFDCWWESFDVVEYLKKSLPEDTFKRLVNVKPKPKMVSLVELIEQAKNRAP